MMYKVSYVIVGGRHPGAIANRENPPRLGEIIELGERRFEVIEVADLVPPRGDFAYLHVALKPISEGPANS